MGKVSIVKTSRGIEKGLGEALELIGGLNRYVRHHDRVMLKPNLNGVEGCTNIELTESLINMLLEFGVKEVFVAESTFGGARMTDMFFKKSGYLELAGRYAIDIINLNESKAVEVEVKRPLIAEKLRMAREVFEADRIVNLPNMKVHYATGITLALKNLKGVLAVDEKRRFHEIGLDKAIVDLNNTIRPHLNIADCIMCMERMGPRGGDMVQLGLIMAGEDPAEMDYVGSRIMGYDLDEVRHLKYFVEANGTDLGGIEVVGETIEDVRHPFKKVSFDSIVPGQFTIHNRNACSSCMNAFLLSCSLMDREPNRRIDVFLGSIVEEKDILEGLRVAFGNCCPTDMHVDRRVKGCPPYPFALGESLKRDLE